MTVTATITDSPYNADNTGVADARQAFIDFKADAVGQDAILTIPAGTYKIAVNVGPDEDNFLFAGINTLTVNGTGASLVADSNNMFLGSHHMSGIAGNSARINSASKGDTQVVLKTDADASKFEAGKYIAVCAYDTQANHSYPINPALFEYALVDSISVMSPITLTLDAPITQSYSDTYPEYESGTILYPDEGGPATIYAMPSDWGTTNFTFNGLTIINGSAIAATIIGGRNIKLVGCTIGGPNGIWPTINGTLVWDGVTATDLAIGEIEVDKLIANFSIINGSVVTQPLKFQSANVLNFSLLDSTAGDFNGTAKNTIIVNSTVGNLGIGAIAYGVCDTLNCRDSTISSVANFAARETDLTNASILRARDTSAISMSGGVLSMPNSAAPFRFLIPGTRCMWAGQRENETMFNVTDISQDGSNTYVQTDQVGTYPAIPLIGGTRIDMVLPPVQKPALFSNCIGCADVKDWSQTGAVGKHLHEYTKRVYTLANGNLTNPIPATTIWGRIVRISVYVTEQFTTSPRTLNVFGQFAANALDENLSLTEWNAVIDINDPGERTFDPINKWVGTKTLDTLTDPGNIWFSGTNGPYVSGSITGGDPGSVTIEVITDQGFPIDATKVYVPIRL